MSCRQALKEYSNWPTYPQLYVDGELVGGCDIVLEMQQTGDLQQLIKEKAPAALQPPKQQQQPQVGGCASIARVFQQHIHGLALPAAQSTICLAAWRGRRHLHPRQQA